MNKSVITAAIAALGFAGLASAQNITFEDVDANGDGLLTLAEVQAVAENVTEDEFNAYDADRDGALNEVEFDAWLAAYAGGEEEGEGEEEPYVR